MHAIKHADARSISRRLRLVRAVSSVTNEANVPASECFGEYALDHFRRRSYLADPFDLNVIVEFHDLDLKLAAGGGCDRVADASFASSRSGI